jgi:iron complex outermembrane receptor protein
MAPRPAAAFFGASMKHHQFPRHAIGALLSIGSAALATSSAAAETSTLAPVTIVVSGSRIAHDSFDLPAAIDVVDSSRIQDGQLRVNASEALVAVPGLVVQNRQNYAQDLQISSRGFGARSAFGVRGVRLIADGIPATMPDGQGQAATFNLDMAERIEVLRGPFSALYGNHSGGVVQLFTRDGKGTPTLESSVMAGSDGALKIDLNTQGEANGIGYVLDGSRFRTDGYRDHSAATRDQAYAKITVAPSSTSRLTLVANGLRQNDTQDPLGVQWATYLRDPRAGEIDTTDTQSPKRTFAERYNTRKSIQHQQLGLAYEERFGDDRLHVTLYGGNRQVIQYQAFSKAFQAAPTHSGGVVDFDRNFYGADINWVQVRELAGGKLTATVGIDVGRSDDDRQGYENYVGTEFGVKGKLRRDEQDLLRSIDPYAQAEWASGPWLLTAGLRHTRLKIDVQDRFLSNGNDSGSKSYSHTTPVLAALYKVSPVLNLYASFAHGFETPTLNELFYSGTGAGFNFKLEAARSKHVEVGAKTYVGGNTLINTALFQVRTSDELVVDASGGGRTSYRNASKTLRQGAEISLDTKWGRAWSARIAATALRAVVEQGFGSTLAGSRLPGVPNANLYSELAWKSASGNTSAALEAIAYSKVYADDANTEIPAPGYGLLNARVQLHQEVGQWRLQQFVRLNNLMDRQTVGSVIVGDTNKRFYEAAPGRNWQLGMSARYAF